MRFFLFGLLLFFVFIFQISFLPVFLMFWAIPNILFVSLIFFSFSRFDFRELMALAFYVGILLSIYSGSAFGVILLAILTSVSLMNFLAYNFFGKVNFFVFCAGVAVGSVFYEIFYLSSLKLYELLEIAPVSVPNFNLVVWIASVSIIANVLSAAVLYLPLKKTISLVNKK